MLVTLLGVNCHNRIEIYNEITNFSCMKSITVIEYCLFVRRRHVGMADDADSKSVVGNHVRVQVPLPAFAILLRSAKSKESQKFINFWDFLLLFIQFHDAVSLDTPQSIPFPPQVKQTYKILRQVPAPAMLRRLQMQSRSQG